MRPTDAPDGSDGGCGGMCAPPRRRSRNSATTLPDVAAGKIRTFGDDVRCWAMWGSTSATSTTLAGSKWRMRPSTKAGPVMSGSTALTTTVFQGCCWARPCFIASTAAVAVATLTHDRPACSRSTSSHPTASPTHRTWVIRAAMPRPDTGQANATLTGRADARAAHTSHGTTQSPGRSAGFRLTPGPIKTGQPLTTRGAGQPRWHVELDRVSRLRIRAPSCGRWPLAVEPAWR